jgi:Fic family protein
MNSGERRYIWEANDWPDWRYDLTTLAEPLVEASRSQGLLLGRLADLGVALRNQASLLALTEDVVKTSEIEGEVLNVASVRSSLARRLGVDVGAVAPVDRHVEGVVDMVLDATSRATSSLTAARLQGWHAALFSTGFSGMSKIAVSQWRSDADGPMQLVFDLVGRRQVHFEAPPAETLPKEMAQFLAWANHDSGEPALVKAGLAHPWFVTLHPFDDGNGRIARAIGDLFLARADGSAQRFYSLSAQIQHERKNYYDVLERTQKGTLDLTCWLAWFLGTLGRAVNSAHGTLGAVLAKARFWQRWAGIALNKRQVKVLNRVLNGLEGKLTSSKWASLAKCSPDTALRDITQLLDLCMLTRAPGGGRSTAYELACF